MANKSKNITKQNQNITKSNKNKSLSDKLNKDNKHLDKQNKSEDRDDESVICTKVSNNVDDFEQVFPNSSDIISKGTKMNAFQVMMLARNKVIGSNSPGKELEKKVEISEEVEKKRDLRVKRKLKLQEMANLKGAHDNIEKEKVKYDYVQYCLNKRAKRLKNYMSDLEKKDRKEKKKNIKLNPIDNNCRENVNIDSDVIPGKINMDATDENSKVMKGYLKRQRKDEKSEKHNLKKAKLDECTSQCDIIDIEKQPRNHRLIEIISDSEDDEFLSKLSPSIKRNSSVTSYFNKIEKSNEISQSSTKKTKGKTNEKASLLKNKIKTHRYTKSKINDAIQTVATVEENSNNELHISANNNVDISVDQKSEGQNAIESLVLNSDPNQRRNIRPKRNIKKPVKYISDEDMDDYIFPPNKTKKESTKISFIENKKISTEKENELPKSSKKKNQNKKTDKPLTKTRDSTKFAPIFASKPEIRKKIHEDKIKFLHSGIPEILRKSIEKQKRRVKDIDLFPKVLHSQQIPIEKHEIFDPWRLPALSLDNIGFHANTECSFIEDKDWKQFLRLSYFKADEIVNEKESNRKSDLKHSLQDLKNRHLKFPVYRFYKRLLKRYSTIGKPGNDTLLPIKELDNSFEIFEDGSTSKNLLSEKLTWTDKYKPSSSFDIIGNFDSIKRLKKWLSNWKELNNEIGHSGLSSRRDSNSSSDFCYSDHESTDSMKVANNVMILTGPPGSGKTSAVYAIANELSMNVLEVNASAKRTGKKIISDLLEATQSHIVHRTSHSQDFNSQSLIEIKNNKMRLSPKKLGSKNNKLKSKIRNSDPHIDNETAITGSQTTSTFEMSIILVEDVDIVFEQDDGFIPALAQIVQNSKRPVLMISNSINCFHLQRFVNSENIITFHALSPKTLGTWLDLLILVESKRSYPSIGAALLDYYNGDIRKVVNLLQFWTESGGYKLNCESVLEKSDSGLHSSEEDCNIDDTSNQSWISQESNSDNATENKYSHVLFDILKISNSTDSFKNLFLFELFSFWWNIPAMLNLKCALPNSKCEDSTNANIDIKKARRVKISQMDQLSLVCDNNSVMDMVCKSSSIIGNFDYLLEKPWMSYPQANNSEDQDMACYSENKNFATSWCQSTISLSLDSVRKMANHLGKDENLDIIVPDASLIKARSKIIKDHTSLHTVLPSSCPLDRRGLALDYYPALRAICRTEKARSSLNVKRNNRCSHYMKSLDRYAKIDVFDSLCDSLNTVGDHL